MKSLKVAVPRFFKYSLVVLFLFASISLILAPSNRVTQRVSALLQHTRPYYSSTPSFFAATSTSRPAAVATSAIMNSQASQAAKKKVPQLPPTFTATPLSIIEATKELIRQSRKVQDDVVSSVKPEDAAFDNVLLPLARDENHMADQAHILCFYQAVSADQALRDKSTEAEELFNDLDIESSMREDVFKLVDAVQKKAATLAPENQRLLDKVHKGYIQSGLGIPAGAQRDRFKEIMKRLSTISTVFQKNLNEETGGIWLAPEELDGVPEDVISGLKKGEGEHAGKLRLSFKYPDLFPTLKYAKNPLTRKQVFVGNENKCNKNVPLFKEAIVLRDEAARMLGYPNHAAFRIEDKMAKTTKTVDDFLGDLRTRLAPGGKTELEKLKALKAQDVASGSDSSSNATHYYLWDHRYYDRLMVETEYSVDQQKVAEYFPLQTTVQGMLNIFSSLFGLVFVSLPSGEARDKLASSGRGSDIAWHPDVQVFSVWNDEGEGGDFVGYLYLDMFPRDGKYGHAANFNLQPGYRSSDGSRHHPATALVCNFSPPTPTKPSLLKHDEVVTLFHELGHGIHDLVSITMHSRFHGTNTVRDFVEAPSQMLENWCWTPSQLRSLSQHYSYLSSDSASAWSNASKLPISERPAEKMPDELISSLVKSQHVNDALFNLRQLHFGTFDMTIHTPSSHSTITALDATSLFNSLRKSISQLEGLEGERGGDMTWGNGQATFGHLMGGYDAGYYGYLSSQVYSADMFASVFKKDPMNGTEGRRYRHTVLEKGGSQEEMKTLEDFLGRKPSSEAFYRELGLAT